MSNITRHATVGRTPVACLFSWLTGALMLGIGFLIGAIVTAYLTARQQPVRIVTDESEPDVAVVQIEGIRDGALLGSARGRVRVSAGGTVIPLDQSGSFAIRDSRILTNRVTLTAPPGMKFVASKRGTKYYPLGSAEAGGIVPENRVYFPDELSARNAGYVR